MSTPRTVLCSSEADTRSLGRRLGEAAVGGLVLELQGDLGAGKTVLAQGIGVGLGVGSAVTSPTFVLVAEHGGGRLPLVHADLYRLSAEEVRARGLDEALDRSDALVLVEWPERAPQALEGLRGPRVRVELREATATPGAARTVELRASNDAGGRWLEVWWREERA